jgi:hypothetical protein
MIAPSRFIETSDNHEAWLEARRLAVTATEIAWASTPAGFLDAVKDRLNPSPVEPNDFMRFGSDNEEWISRFIKREHGIMPNRWLIAAEQNELHMATPDGLSLDHTRISEVKTAGKEPKSPPMAHRRQVAWQLWCTGATECVYAFMLRAEVNGRLVPAWMEPKTWVIERDDDLIDDLIGTAGRLLDTTKENPND